ncbi:MAG: hypothetical protein PHE55_00115 [Methylococcaceae bacterium]|nr:hypothetical protein [Methylococcaceae bacterium]
MSSIIKRAGRVSGRVAAALPLGALIFCTTAQAVDQTVPGAGNAAATQLSSKSPLVQSAYKWLLKNTKAIKDANLRNATLNIISNPKVCIQHRANLGEAEKEAILTHLMNAGLYSTVDAGNFPGGAMAGVFPPVLQDGSACPQLPQPFTAAPGSAFGGHHSQPGGLVVHEVLNDMSDMDLAKNYKLVYGTLDKNGLPVVGSTGKADNSKLGISNDIIVAAPMWHDFTKTMVFQWNADGSEFKEFNFGGGGLTDNNGKTGDSRTGSHHILALAEAIKRGLAPDFVITQASAHSVPSLGNEFKVVNWIRAAAIIANVDPVQNHYLILDNNNNYRLPAVRTLGEFDLIGASPTRTNLLVEYVLHNISDSDYSFTGPALDEISLVLQKLAPEYGYDFSDISKYNNKFRNPIFSYLSAERLFIIYSNEGLDGVRREIGKLVKIKLI